ncbi:MAG: hypothetical protein KGZ39_02285 [Simkania sp.]|nr:hypothetical protein [Simkania sp.]
MSDPRSRPSKREIDKKLTEAKTALSEKRLRFARPDKAVGELVDLEINDTAEVADLILKLLDEIEISHYAGGHPPEPSYEPNIADCELWAFSWESKERKVKMYLKFALKNDYFYYVSLHKSKPSKEHKV